jgi:glycerol-3-phosphate acyltransferase PlsX
MRLAVDVMGGDHAPDAILKGCFDALADLPQGDELVLVGPEGLIRETMREHGVRDGRLVVEHADQIIGMDESPATAVRSKARSSIVRLFLVGSGRAEIRADAVLSAGNTGACVTAAIMYMKRLPGVLRPGIAVTIPAFHGPVVLCDAGANPEPKPTHLWQYALMADTYARQVLGIGSPRVALMNIGAEEGKGTDIIREAREMLRRTPDLNDIGYVEGRDFFEGVADVIVTDAFVGNTVLKMAEGLARSLFNAIAQEIMAENPRLALEFEPVVRRIYAKNDYHEYGGAPLLGVNGACMIAHGSSQPRAIRAAIRNGLAFVRTGVNEAIVRRLSSSAAAVRAPQEAT